MLEVFRKQGHGKSARIADDEAVAVRAPHDHPIGARIVHHLVGLGKERRRPGVVQALHGLRSDLREIGRGGRGGRGRPSSWVLLLHLLEAEIHW